MTEAIGDIILAVTVLLLAILNHQNGKRINNLENLVNALIFREAKRREP